MQAKRIGISDLEGLEGGRRPTGKPSKSDDSLNSEVVPPTKRRYLSVGYKTKVLQTLSQLRSKGQGAVGAFLRAEGLYYSLVKAWEQQAKNGGLTVNSRGPKRLSSHAATLEIQQLKRKLEQAEKKLIKAEMIIELQKKISAFMEIQTIQNIDLKVTE